MAVEILSLILFLILTLVSVLKISYVDENIGEQIILGNDSVIGNLMALLFVCILGTLISGWIRKLGNKGDKAIRLLLVVTCVWGFAFSLFWFLAAKYAPNADQASVYTIAIQFSKGDYSAICPKDSYLSCYPHQLGLVAFYELILRAFHSESFRLLECVNIPMVPAIIYGGYQLIPFITHRY